MAPKPQTKSPMKAQRCADGGAVGLQPTLALADGGSLDQGGKGPWGGNLNSNTTTFNQDWLRGPNFGDRSSADMINYVPPAPTGTTGNNPNSGGSTGSPKPAFDQSKMPGEVNPDGSTNLDAQGARIAADGPALGNAAIGALGFMNPVLGATLGAGKKIFNAATDAYAGYNGLQPADTSLATRAGAWLGSMSDTPAAQPSRVTAPGTVQTTELSPSQATEAFQPSAGLVTQVDAAPAPIAPAATAAPDAAPTAAYQQTIDAFTQQQQNQGGRNGGSWTNPSNPASQSNGGDAMGVGGGVNGFGGNAAAADGGMAAPGGFQRAGQPGAMPGVGQPPGPPGLQMPGAAQPPQQAAGPMHPALAALHVQNKMANPQVMQAMQTHITQAIQSGQVNPQQLMMMGQLAQSALQHPELWPKLRQFAIQAGIPDAQQLPMQFSQGLAMALLAASHAAQHGDRPGAFANGGQLHGPGTGTSDSIPAHNQSTGQPVRLSNGEYVIPKDVVDAKGREYFDSLVRKYHTPAAMQANR